MLPVELHVKNSGSSIFIITFLRSCLCTRNAHLAHVCFININIDLILTFYKLKRSRLVLWFFWQVFPNSNLCLTTENFSSHRGEF